MMTTPGLSVSGSAKTGDTLSELLLFAQKEQMHNVKMAAKRIQFAFFFLSGKEDDKILDAGFICFFLK